MPNLTEAAMATMGSMHMLKPGERALITRITARGELGRRIRDMGLAAGTVATVMSRALLKDVNRRKVIIDRKLS